mmetsp:Transcript_50867/g.58340  ORF Transcript_50867/g.58340 Transcript_50867/m.58340 type:complete len:87 (+) Transcript_50867:191-451(+)
MPSHTDNRIGPDGGIAVAQALKFNRCVEVIEIAENFIQQQGGTPFKESLRINQTVKKIVLAGNEMPEALCAELLKICDDRKIQTQI